MNWFELLFALDGVKWSYSWSHTFVAVGNGIRANKQAMLKKTRSTRKTWKLFASIITFFLLNHLLQQAHPLEHAKRFHSQASRQTNKQTRIQLGQVQDQDQDRSTEIFRLRIWNQWILHQRTILAFESSSRNLVQKESSSFWIPQMKCQARFSRKFSLFFPTRTKQKKSIFCCQ